jgi:crotonobetainyl-CoA:carnitine CoA-transferase CaiB-like acyl-CoA transferase
VREPLERHGPAQLTESVGPLKGIRVLDLSWGVAGPVGVLMLAELGADVVKVEPPGGDPFRRQPAYHVWNRSRRSVVLNLKSEEGRAAFFRLCDGADVVVETFSPGTMDRLGLSYAELSQRCPRLVLCSVPAYPPGHRFADRPGWDGSVQALSGMQNEQPGWRAGPVFLHFPAPSMAACFLLAAGVLSALISREADGKGQHVQTSLYQGVLAYTTQIWQEHERPPARYRHTMAKTYPPGVHQLSLFECADGEWIHAATMNGLTPTRTQEEILGLDPVDPMAVYRDLDLRAQHQARLREAYRRHSRAKLIETFHAAGLGAEAVTPMAEVFSHPQFVANGMAAEVEDPELGATTQVGVPAVLRGTPGGIRGGQPPVGAHSREVLTEAGYSEGEIEFLIEAGVVEEDSTWVR